ncbi:PAS domain S-box-containing protein/TyrR family helix-turn-helix domain-containing protein [Dethiosulfatibacter aminovorans DSM 17477]|uniref:HTH-type transcriptional regulatory protein TyrR n=1 Tax=Dethiosulfatibacter aminovorans DSM 17477 TaxID=1121476 RepID=A0A1M6DRC8_9FIRM|nr:sigma 54-interacting transcriptional regulator [Dethiosulfatibacter aminovorans]SHI75751.1 PAS domain S-box-containing protein/TyrR family helix-turn-helix domain-containing protein [Dethiosulfatibacter aminovorans DSM 17477]
MKSEIEDLKEQLMVQKLIFNNAYDGLYIVDAKGYTEDVNEAYLKMMGLKREDLVGYHMEELRKKGYFTKSAVLEALETSKTVTVLFLYNGKKCLSTAKPIFDNNGEVFKIITSTRDITDLTELQNKIEETEKLNKKYKEEINYLRQEKDNSDNIIGESDSFKKNLELVHKVAKYDSTVLITGETGTGKEIIAREIHRTSFRKNKPFIKVNCAAIPENLLESELFGFEKGAFTGAHKSKLGKFELADSGTILLDEIGEMPLSLQSKLLRVLQEKEITHLGGVNPIKIDIRIIASTNRNIEELIDKGSFRQDLFYRLNVVPIQVPALRDRKEDIILLIKFFLEKFNMKHNKNIKFDIRIFNILERYRWPGNIRELENLIERLVVVSENDIVDSSVLSNFLSDKYLSQFDSVYKSGNTFSSIIESVEKQILKETYDEFKSTRKVAKVLGLSQTTVVRKMKKHKITY